MYKHIDNLLTILYKKNPIHKKKIELTFSKKDKDFFVEFENFLDLFSLYLEENGLNMDYAIDSYLLLCKNMFASQIYFLKTGKYPADNLDNIIKFVYTSKETMMAYIIGLALSEFLWDTHYEMYSFFDKWLKKESNNIKQYLEVAPGHGLFLRKAIYYLKNKSFFKIIDISPISIEITKSIISFSYPELPENSINYHCANILEIDITNKYDFITAGEILEHLCNPKKMLYILKNLLADNGKIYLSTCANCPAIDHIYKFNCISEIKDMIENEGLKILDELILPVEKMDMKEIINKKITINYCAILGRHFNDKKN